MRKTKIIVSALLVLSAVTAALSGCMGRSGDEENPRGNDYYYQAGKADLPSGKDFVENGYIRTEDENVSTFSADVDTAAYSYFRKLVNSGYTLEELAEYAGKSIRTEEMVNYFGYGYSEPEGDDVFGVRARISDCAWNRKAKLLCVNLKAKDAIPAEGNNLVFLIDVSGSMNSADKLELLKKSFGYLTANLGEKDVVSIVTYSGKEEVVLDGCKGSKTETILAAIGGLKASGSTNGEAGIKKAYDIAKKHFIEGGNNRIIMASDGDLNVGIRSDEELKALVEEKRGEGVYLSVLGFGTGNYRDSKMETLADNGNGVYYYIDGETEAEKVFGDDILSTLYTVADDVKFQLTFNKERVASYRLVGYENRLLDNDDFLDDTKDAGEVGVGHTVTVLYEIVLNEPGSEETEPDEPASDGEIVTLAINARPAGSGEHQIRHYAIGNENIIETPDDDLKFISCVVKLAMVLHGSKYLADGDRFDAKDETEKIYEDLKELDLSDDAYKTEFASLVGKLIGKTGNGK